MAPIAAVLRVSRHRKLDHRASLGIYVFQWLLGITLWCGELSIYTSLCNALSETAKRSSETSFTAGLTLDRCQIRWGKPRELCCCLLCCRLFAGKQRDAASHSQFISQDLIPILQPLLKCFFTNLDLLCSVGIGW